MFVKFALLCLGWFWVEFEWFWVEFEMVVGWCWLGFGCFGSRSPEDEKVEELEPMRAREGTTGRDAWVVVGVCFWFVCWLAWSW